LNTRKHRFNADYRRWGTDGAQITQINTEDDLTPNPNGHARKTTGMSDDEFGTQITPPINHQGALRVCVEKIIIDDLKLKPDG